MRASALVCALLLVGCDPAGDDEGDASSDGGAPDCENGPVVTYDTFGRGFLASYCNGCHGNAVVERQGAPVDIVFDTAQGASSLADRIAARVIPEGDAPPTMPPAGGITPDDRERVRVWLTCWP